jgi:hypothetical protein
MKMAACLLLRDYAPLRVKSITLTLVHSSAGYRIIRYGHVE